MRHSATGRDRGPDARTYLTQGVRVIQNADDFIVPALSTPGGLFSVNQAAQVIWDRISSSNMLH